MIRKITTLLLVMIMILSLAGCKEEETKVEENTESVIETVEESVEETTEPEIEEVTDDVEDIIGDVDSGEITLENCRTWKMGYDISNKKFDGAETNLDYQFLFPNSSYITDSNAGYLYAKGEVIDYVEINITPIQAESFPGASQGILKETDTGIVFKKIFAESGSLYEANYYLKDGEKCFSAKLVIKSKKDKSEDEKTIFNKFKEEFIPAFEESLMENI